MIPAKILAVTTNAGNERYGEHKGTLWSQSGGRAKAYLQ
jgi:hypothetical protein